MKVSDAPNIVGVKT